MCAQIEEWPTTKDRSWGRQPGGFYMAERAGRAQRQRGAAAQQQQPLPPPPPQQTPRGAPRQVLAKPIVPAERKANTTIAAAKRPRKEPVRCRLFSLFSRSVTFRALGLCFVGRLVGQ